MDEHRFELNAGTAPDWVTEHGLNPQLVPLTATEVHEGVSASVVAVTGDGVRLLLKQALARLRVPGIWEGRVERAGTEAAALRLLDSLTPGVVPRVLAYDSDDQVIAMELLPADARNWQAQINEGVVHGWARLGARAGAVLGIWHRSTT